MKKYSLISTLFFTISCTLGSQDEVNLPVCLKEGAGSGSFTVEEVTGGFNEVGEGPGILKSKFTLEFAACIKDTDRKQPMKNHTFYVHTFRDQKQEKKKINNTLCEGVEWECLPIAADNNGCLRWREPYNFALPAEQKWIEFKRVIYHRTGGHVIPMMINPWIEQENKIIDLRIPNYEHYLAGRPVFQLHKTHASHDGEEKSELQKCREEGSLDDAFAYLDKNEEKAFLWVDEVDFSPSFEGKPGRFNDPDYNYREDYHICDPELNDEEFREDKNCDREGVFLNLNLKIPLKVIYKDGSGITTDPAKGTKFMVTFYLLSQVPGNSSSNSNGGKKEAYMLHRPVDPIITSLTASGGERYIYLDNAWLHTPYETTEGTSTLLLEIKPLGGKQLESFYGVYDINDRSVSDLHGISKKLLLRSPYSTIKPSDHTSEIELHKQRILENKQVFKQFDADDAYDKYRPQVGQGGFYVARGLSLELSRMRFARVKASGSDLESPVKRTAVYLGEVCLSNPTTRRKYKVTNISVTAEDLYMSRDEKTNRLKVDSSSKSDSQPIVNSKPSDTRGCVQFTYEVPHKLYNIQKYFLKKLTFSVDKDDNLKDHKYIALNPWEYGFLTYQEFTQAYTNWEDSKKAYKMCLNDENCLKKAQDELKASENNVEYPFKENLQRLISQKKKCEKNKCEDSEINNLTTELDFMDHLDSENSLASPLFSENLKSPILRMNEYRNVIIEPSYKLEPSLDIQTVKNLQLLLQPTIVRQDSPGETIRQLPRILPIGYYLVRVIIAKGPQETKEGKELIMDRNPQQSDAVNSAVKMMDDIELEGYWSRLGDTLKRWRKPESSIASLIFSDIEGSINEATQAYKDLKEFRSNRGYDFYSKLTKAANAEDINNITDGCQGGDRVPCFHKEDYIAHFDTVVRSENGVLNAFVKLGFNVEHFRHLGSKNSILIEVYPTDPNFYEYTTDKEGKRTLDKEQTTFKPFPQCAQGDNPDEKKCHQLETPAHWGLFFSTEFGNVNIMWPIKRDFKKLFGLPDLEIKGKPDYLQDIDDERLTLMKSALSSTKRQNDPAEKEFYNIEKTINDAYESFKDSLNINNRNNRFDKDRLTKYCENVKADVDKIESMDLLGEEDLSKINLLDVFVCSRHNKGSTVDQILFGRDIQSQIRDFFLYQELGRQRRQQNIDPIEEYRQVQVQEGAFCGERDHKTSTYENDESDFSKLSLSYQDCVCGSPNEESTTKKMARCFAESQDLIFEENNAQFLERLKRSADKSGDSKMNSVDSLQITMDNGGINPLIISRDFLESMCTFWFNEYYKNYLNLDSIEKILNHSMTSLESLYSSDKEKLQEQFLVDFGDFKNILSNSSAVANLFQAFYRNGDHEPFVHHNTQSSALHPYHTCQEDPLKFFHIEGKTMVDQLDINSNSTRYKNGRVFSLMAHASEGAHTRVEMSKRRQATASARGELRGEPGELKRKPRNMLLELFRVTLGAGFGIENARTRTASGSEHISIDSTKSVLLAVNHIEMNLALKKHRTCLVIRPKTNAFEKVLDGHWNSLKKFWKGDLPSAISELDDAKFDDTISLMRLPYTSSGLLICEEESSEERVVPEDYYYVHQFFGGHAYEFMSRTIYHNRPYTEIIRGQDQMDKFIRIIHSTIYNGEENDLFKMRARIRGLDLDRSKMDQNLISAFEHDTLDWSGFFKGVYTYPDLMNDYEKPEEQGLFDGMMDDAGRWWADDGSMDIMDR